MNTSAINADFAAAVHLRTAAMPWQGSPAAGVWRKRLELSGPVEAGRVTAIVRYDPGSVFPHHEHPQGEEILVLDGVFEDEHGVYPAGTYLLNPEGFGHAPRSTEGCTLLVKLRQYPGARRQVRVDTRAAAFGAGSSPGILETDLYREPGQPELVRLVRFEPGAAGAAHRHPAGEEILVLAGVLLDEAGRYGAGDWTRSPPDSGHEPSSAVGCLLYVKSGHLGAAAAAV